MKIPDNVSSFIPFASKGVTTFTTLSGDSIAVIASRKMEEFGGSYCRDIYKGQRIDLKKPDSTYFSIINVLPDRIEWQFPKDSFGFYTLHFTENGDISCQSDTLVHCLDSVLVGQKQYHHAVKINAPFSTMYNNQEKYLLCNQEFGIIQVSIDHSRVFTLARK